MAIDLCTYMVHIKSKERGDVPKERKMKKILNGQRWDTEKAKLVCEVRHSNPRDFNYVRAALYQTLRSKRFFLAGEGGPMTVFAHYDSDNSCSGGEKLIPLSAEEARRYAEQYADAETVERFFDIEEA